MSNRVDAAKIARELEKLRRQDGSHSAEDVRDWAAEHPKSSLYTLFEWNNRKAGDEYRLWQARQIIKAYVVEIDTGEASEVIPVVSVPKLRGKGAGSYLPRSTVMGREDYRGQVLDEVKSKLVAMCHRFEPLTPELKTVWKAIKTTCEARPVGASRGRARRAKAGQGKKRHR